MEVVAAVAVSASEEVVDRTGVLRRVERWIPAYTAGTRMRSELLHTALNHTSTHTHERHLIIIAAQQASIGGIITHFWGLSAAQHWLPLLCVHGW